MNGSELSDVITAVLRRAPDWVRVDLTSRDPATRARAEDTLAGMIAAAIVTGEEPSFGAARVPPVLPESRPAPGSI